MGVTVSTIQQGINVKCVRQVSTTDPGEQAQQQIPTHVKVLHDSSSPIVITDAILV